MHIVFLSSPSFVSSLEPARINRTSPLPPSTDTGINVGAGRPDEPVRVPRDDVTVRLYCPYTGLDQPTTRWVRVNSNGSTTDVVAMPPDLTLMTSNNNVVLTIRNFDEDRQGTYRCVTDNNAGEDEGDIILRRELLSFNCFCIFLKKTGYTVVYCNH